MIAFAPALATTSTPSRNGKNASEATTGLDVFGHPPGENEVRHLLAVRLRAGHDTQLRARYILDIGRLDEKAAANTLVVKSVGAISQWNLEYAHVRFLRKHRLRIFVDSRRDDDFGTTMTASGTR